MNYFARLNAGRLILWCYLLWYLFFAARYFERSPALWLTSAGISLIVGLALLLSTWHPEARLASWGTFRLFLMPFCVSSFSAMVKGRGFLLIFSPIRWENQCALALCGAFIAFVGLLKWGRGGPTAGGSGRSPEAPTPAAPTAPVGVD